MALDPIGVIFTAKDMASDTVSKLEEKFTSLDKKTTAMSKSFNAAMKTIGMGMGTMALGAGILAPLGGAIDKAASLQEELFNIRKIAGDNVNIEQLAGELNALAPALGMTSVELAKVAKGAAVLQVKGNENFVAFVDGAAKMATALDISVDQASMYGSKLLNVFQIPVSQIQNLGSVFNEMANTTVAGADEIIAATFRSAGSLKGLGFSAGDVAALSSRLIELGLSGEEAGTSLSRAFTSVASQPKDLAKAMGISVAELQQRLGKDAMGTIMGFSQQLAKMPNQAKALGMASQIFGEQGSKAILRLGTDTERLNFLVETANRGFKEGTSLAKEFASVTEGFNFIMKQVKASVDAFATTIGKELLPLVSVLASGVATFFQKALVFIQPFAGFIAKFMAFAGTIIFLTGAILTLIGAWKLLLLVMAPLWAAALPVLKIVLLLSAAFGLLYLAWRKNFGGFADFIGGVFEKVKLFFQTMFDVITKGEISEALYNNLREAGILGFVEGVLNMFFKLKSFLGGLWDGFVAGFSRFEPVFSVLFDSFKMLGGVLLELFGNAFNTIGNMLFGTENASEALSNMANIGKFVGAIIGNAIGLVASGLATIIAAANGFLSLLLKVVSVLTEIASLVTNAIGGAFSKLFSWISNSGFGKLVGKVMGVDFSSAAAPAQPAALPFPGPDARNQSNIQPINPMFTSPTAGLDSLPLAAQAMAAPGNNVARSVQDLAKSQGSGGKELVIRNVTVLDGKVVAESVNRTNERQRLAAGGQN